MYENNCKFNWIIFKVNNLLSGDDEDRIKELMNDNYHIEIELFNNCSEINIHKKI